MVGLHSNIPFLRQFSDRQKQKLLYGVYEMYIMYKIAAIIATEKRSVEAFKM